MNPYWQTVAAPIAAGGTGGSGTRVIPQVLSAAGVYMGAHLNRAGDSLDLADFDWRWGKPYLEAELAGVEPPSAAMEQELVLHVRAHLDGFDASAPWGWKHPHAYLLLPWLDAEIADLRFIHVVRDGQRIARSRNQKQPQHYGAAVFGERAGGWEEQELALRFWGWANERAADYGERHMQGRYLRIRFEDICERPQEACAQLIAFAQRTSTPSEQLVSECAALVKPPPANEGSLTPAAQTAATDSLRRFGYV